MLHLRGEQEYPVPPLGVPDSATCRRSPTSRSTTPSRSSSSEPSRAAGLRRDLRERPGGRRDLRPTRRPAAGHRAGGRAESSCSRPTRSSPASRRACRLLTGGARDLPARQQTLRGAIDWSYNLLDAAERVLFRRLRVFGGGCTIECAQTVCDPDLDLGLDVARRARVVRRQEPAFAARKRPTASRGSACLRRSASTRRERLARESRR